MRLPNLVTHSRHEAGPDSLTLERHSAGELDKETSARVEEHLRFCTSCARYVETLRTEQQAFLTKHPYAIVVPIHRAALQKSWVQKVIHAFSRPLVAPAFGFVAALIIAMPIMFHVLKPQTAGEAITYKGSAQMAFLLKRNGTISDGNAHDIFYAGDEIQILYSAQKARYVCLLSVDSKGALSLYGPGPDTSTCSVRAERGPNRPYPVAVLLDTAKGAETMMTLFSNKPLATKRVRQWVSAALTGGAENADAFQRRLRQSQNELNAEIATLILRKG